MPVKTSAMPRSSAAAMTSWSRTEPPGSMTAETPAAASVSMPSRKGKSASLAAEPPRRTVISPSHCPLGCTHPALVAGTDADRGSVRRDHDRIRLGVGGDGPGEFEVGPFVRGGLAGGDSPPIRTTDIQTIFVWARKPPSIERKFQSIVVGTWGDDDPQAPFSRRAWRGTAGSTSGTMTTSMKRLAASVRSVAVSSGRFSATTPPKAESGSQSQAAR